MLHDLFVPACRAGLQRAPHTKVIPMKPKFITTGSSGRRQASLHVLVMATMSAGKSSFINALIGRELLPSANEATTACLTSIRHRPAARSLHGACYAHGGAHLETCQALTLGQVRAWNHNVAVGHICLSGRFDGLLALPARLVLHDTPGPNNSQDGSHARFALDAMHTVPFHILCYVLDSGQLGTEDDRALLLQLREQLQQRPDRRLIFILNKVDLLDPERGEDLASCVGRTRNYLEGIGFSEPVIVPLMAALALSARKAMTAVPLTRVERHRLRSALNTMAAAPTATMNAADVPAHVQPLLLKHLARTGRPTAARHASVAPTRRQLEQLIGHSGIRTVEFLINHHHQPAI